MTAKLTRHFSLIGAIIPIALGLVVLIGWYTHRPDLIQIHPQFAPMQYNTAFCFLLSGVGFFAVVKKLKFLGLSSALLTLLISSLTLFQYISQFDLGIDQLLMDAYITVKTSHPGRMSPNTALCFMLVSNILLLKFSRNKNQVTFASIEISGFIVLAFASKAIMGYLLHEDDAYAWDVYTRMAIHTAVGFFVLGLCFLVRTWNSDKQKFASIPLWLPSLLFLIVLYFDVITPLGVAIGIAYVPLIFFSLTFYAEKASFMFAALATLFTLFGLVVSTETSAEIQYVVINRLLSLVAIWITAIVIYLHKITEQKLRKSEEALLLGWQGAGDGMWDWDVESNKVVFSDRFLALLGFAPGEMEFRFEEWANRLHDEDKEKTLAALDSHIKNKMPYDIEYRLLTKSGDWRWYHAKGQALWNEKGEPTRMSGSLSDITDRKTKELELRLLKLAVDTSKDVVVITEPDPENPIIVFASKATLDICGYLPEEMIGRTPKFLQGEKTDKEQLKALKEALKRDEAFSTELLNYAKDGREYWIDINIVPVKNEHGETTHFAAIERDITQSKRLEEEREELINALQKSNQELDEFAYVASHDLKAPLRVIDNASGWLEEDLGDKLDDESRENLQLLRSRVNRMEKLLDDLLEYSRVGRKLDADYEELVSGEVLFNDICHLLTNDNNKDFKINATPEFLALNVNRMPLQQIFLNLISNAIKHHDRKDGEINISVEKQHHKYLMTVKDDGPGIPIEFHDKIFKMFQTLRPRDQVEGSGMGLAVVRKHIESFGGKITIESEVGKGSTFKFTWPINTKTKG